MRPEDPRCSMYILTVFTYMYLQNYPNVGEQTIHWASGDEIFFRNGILLFFADLAVQDQPQCFFGLKVEEKAVKRSERPLDHEESIRKFLKQRRNSGTYAKRNKTWQINKYPIPSMYGIFTYIWLIFMVNLCKYTIHGSCGYRCMIFIWFLYDYCWLWLSKSKL